MGVEAGLGRYVDETSPTREVEISGWKRPARNASHKGLRCLPGGPTVVGWIGLNAVLAVFARLLTGG